MNQAKILWADDEIDLLKPHVLFLEKKGFQLKTVSSGFDAIQLVENESFDIVFLDENMPGMTGIETLAEIKKLSPLTPVVMITKSEEEHIMEQAIGSQIADYLIKPVNPNQILLSCKKLLEGKSLVSQKTNQSYQQDFQKIVMALFDNLDTDAWVDLYKKLIHWEIKMDAVEDKSMLEILMNQKSEANTNFCKYVSENYVDWVNGKGDKPLFSPDVMTQKVFPIVKEKEKVFFFLVDCLRYDQWKVFEQSLASMYHVEEESHYYSLLPTATHYARNALFAGMWPIEIAKKYPKNWLDDDEEGGKNLNEADFLQELIVKNKLNIKHSYTKIITAEDAKNFDDNLNNYYSNDLNVVVVNFIDLLAHSRSEMNIIKELAPNESALRSLTKSWLEHSSFLNVLKKLREQKVKIIITSDHGMVKVGRPIKIIGDRATTTNLRYKQGKNLNYEEKNRFILTIKNPEQAKLPKTNVSSTYVFTKEDAFLVYPNNYNYFVNMFKDTFQHGGISLEEMIVPFIVLSPK